MNRLIRQLEEAALVEFGELDPRRAKRIWNSSNEKMRERILKYSRLSSEKMASSMDWSNLSKKLREKLTWEMSLTIPASKLMPVQHL